MTSRRFFRSMMLLGLLSVLGWQCQQSKSNDASGGIQVSYNLCLPSENYSVLEDSTQQRWYVENFNLDTTHHFFSKILKTTEDDTLYISVLNRLAPPEASRLVQQHTERLYQNDRGQNANYKYEIYFLQDNSYFATRYLLADSQNNSLVLFDYVGRDSAHLSSLFQDRELLKQLRKCI